MRRAVARATSAALVVLFMNLFSQVAEPQNVRVILQPVNMRKVAPPFSLSDYSGKQVTLAAYRGKVLLLNFWATDCGGCRLEIPWIANLHRLFQKENVAVLGVSMDVSYEGLKNAAEGWSRVAPFMRAHHISYTILMGDSAVETSYVIQALPVTYLIDREGRIAATYVGLIEKKMWLRTFGSFSESVRQTKETSG